MLEPMMTANEVAEMLVVSLNHLYCLCNKPDGIPAYRIGRRLRFKRDEVEAYIRQQAVKPAVKAEPFVKGRFRYVPGMKVV